MAKLQIGNNFASGIYNLIVSQANDMQAIRLITKQCSDTSVQQISIQYFRE